MKKLTTLTLIGASALTLAAGAASAQPYQNQRGWDPIDRRFEQLDRRIDRGVQRGDLTRNEALRLRGEFRQLIRLERQYSRDGLSYRERADLDRRFDRLSAQIRWDRRDNQYGYGYGPGYRR